MADEGEATPIHPWPIAQRATVVVTTQPPPNIYYDVEILIVPWGPGYIDIDKHLFPDGVIVFNDCQAPPTNDPISTAQPRVDLKISPNNQERVPIVFNSGWPSAEIVLWNTLTPEPQ